jgi:hydrogenase maturation protein HypF
MNSENSPLEMDQRMHDGLPAQRLRIVIQGAVQGVGFRPFIYRLASSLGLNGWVNNTNQGVYIEAEGEEESLNTFLLRIEDEKPPQAFIQSLEFSFLDPFGYTCFEVRESNSLGRTTTLILPDIATCPDCLREIFDPENRRYHYPFTNCTHCGPRFSIIKKLPYDRPNTSMKKFTMCPQCQSEYDNPDDRRFHAQPNACPECGPQLELWDKKGAVLASHYQALLQGVDAIRAGHIVAVKGIGGFHLMADALNDDAVRRLRLRKHREEKPFALMYPSLSMVEGHCRVSELERRLLLSPEAPIVLLTRLSPDLSNKPHISDAVAPSNPYLGIMLPYTPLHHLLMKELWNPVVATSGNLSEEPICIDENDALKRLGEIADYFLVNDRPIIRHVDDSIVCVRVGREQVIRRARGYAPLPIRLQRSMLSLVAVGAHLKNTITLPVENAVFISQHIGDLETTRANEAFEQVISDFKDLYNTQPEKIVCDYHPGYLSTQFAQKSGLPVMYVQHHHAHILSCMAENDIDGDILGVSWDGTGYGLDGSIWGGEFFHVTNTSFKRIAHWRTFPLPGGEKAVKEPRRTALGLLYEILGKDLFSMRELPPVQNFSKYESEFIFKMLERKLNSPVTSSVGRLFDAVSAILGIRQTSNFEGQAAMELEFRANETETDELFSVKIIEDPQASSSHGNSAQSQSELSQSIYTIDWEPMVKQILEECRSSNSLNKISAMFHNTLVEAIVSIAYRVGERYVIFSGGCFQNNYLTERTVRRLREEGFQPYWHQRVPPNDGGISLGQAFAASRNYPSLFHINQGEVSSTKQPI